MKDINVLLLLTPRVQLACLDEGMSVRQALETMRAHGYMAIPLVSTKGEYIGTVSEGDMLWCLMDNDGDLEELEDINITEIVRKEYTPAVKVNTDSSVIIDMTTKQNFIPVVDDRNILMGIVTRKRVIEELTKDETE